MRAPGLCPIFHMKLVDKRTILFHSIGPTELSNFINIHCKFRILEVRTQEEFLKKSDPNLGTLKNSINIPIQEMDKGSFLHLNWHKTILVYCSHSHRSSIVSNYLCQNGFKKVYNLKGGLIQLADKSVLK